MCLGEKKLENAALGGKIQIIVESRNCVCEDAHWDREPVLPTY